VFQKGSSLLKNSSLHVEIRSVAPLDTVCRTGRWCFGETQGHLSGGDHERLDVHVL
jgi:hypothetical protein